MEYLFYFLILVVTVSVIAGFAQSVLYPYVSITPDKLPKAISNELEKWQPPLNIVQVRVQKIRQRYLIDARHDPHPIKIIIQLTPDKEFANSISQRVFDPEQSFVASQTIPNGQVPPLVGQVILNWICEDEIRPSQTKAVRGVLGKQIAFRIDFSNDDFEYRFEITDQAQITYLSKKHIHR